MDTDPTENCGTDSKVSMHSITENKPIVRFPSCRLVLVFMGFLGFVNIYCLRVNLSVALVAMLNHTQLKSYSENTSEDICSSNGTLMPTGTTTFVKEDTEGGEFNWDSHTQGAVLAAFFYGYITTQV